MARPVKLETIADEPRRIEWMEDVCKEELRSLNEQPRRGSGPGNPSAKYSHIGPFELSPDAQAPDRFTAAVVNNDKLERTWEWNRPDLSKQSQSEYDMSLASLMIPMGFSDQEIVNTCIANRRVHDRRPPEKLSYYQRTVGRAHELVDSRRVADESAHVEVEEALEQGPESSLDLLRKRLQIPVAGFIQRGRSPAYYYLAVEGAGEIRLGTAKQALSMSSVRAAIFDGIGCIVPSRKQGVWDGILKLLSSIKRVEEIEEGDRGQETLDWVRFHIEESGEPANRTGEASEDRERFSKAFIANEPFIDGLRRTMHVNTAGLKRFLKSSDMAVLPDADLRARLSEAGFRSQAESIKYMGRTYRRSYWQSEIGGSNGGGRSHNDLKDYVTEIINKNQSGNNGNNGHNHVEQPFPDESHIADSL